MDRYPHPLYALLADIFVDILFPPKCAVCNTFFHPPARRHSRLPPKWFADAHDASETGTIESDHIRREYAWQRLLARHWCTACLGAFEPVQSPQCSCCGIPFQSDEDQDHLCSDCIRQPKPFETARAAGVYSGSLMTAIQRLKYHGKTGLAKPLGWVMFWAFCQHWSLERFDLILPVPLHLKRLRQRGFNQSFLLVKDWVSIAAQLQMKPQRPRVDFRILERRRPTPPQTGLTRKERTRNLKKAFGLHRRAHLNQKTVLLIDDVYTTGSTVCECAGVLLEEGARRVDVFTLARST